MEVELKTSRDVLKRVVKRKKAILCKTLKVDDLTMMEFASGGVVNPAVMSTIRSLNEAHHMACIVENLLLDTPESREKFLDFVKNQSSWMYEEILTEAKAETKDLQVDDYEIDDASFLIHRHFGSSRRFSEVDKKTMTSLVATKSQVAKEVWSRRLSASKSELQQTQNLLEEREKLVKKTNELMKKFIRRNERELHDFSREKSTSEVLMREKDSADETLTELMKRTDFLIKKFEVLLLDKQALQEQRQQCMAILQVDDFSIPIHKLVKQAMDKLSRENESGRTQLKSLKKKTVDLEEELNSKDIQLEKLQAEIEAIKQKVKPTRKISATQPATKSPRLTKREEPTPPSPKTTVPKPSKLFPSLEQGSKPKYCSRPRENSTKAMPLHGRSFLLDVS